MGRPIEIRRNDFRDGGYYVCRHWGSKCKWVFKGLSIAYTMLLKYRLKYSANGSSFPSEIMDPTLSLRALLQITVLLAEITAALPMCDR